MRGRYGPTVVVMLLALVPDLIVSSGAQPVEQLLSRDLHASTFAIELGSAMADAGYALGAVIAVDLVQRFAQRRLYVGALLLAAAGAGCCSLAPDAWTFGVGRTVEGLATGLLLVLALPPLVTTFGARRVPLTMALVNVGLFGAATAGPVVAAGVASTGAWRWEYTGVAAAGVLGAVLAGATLPHRDGLNPDQPFNVLVFPLAIVATAFPFFAASELAEHHFSAPIFWVPLTIGVISLALLAVDQYRRRRSLIPMERLNSTLPFAGTATAMIGGAAFVLGLSALQLWLSDVAHRAPIHGASLLWPGAFGAALAAVAFAVALRTRLLVALVGAGLVCLAGGGVLLLLLQVGGGQRPLVAFAALLLGLGAGMTVAPGLFTAALSISSTEVARVVGVVELLRSEAAFVLAPIVTRLAVQHGSRPARVLGGVHAASWAAVGVAAAGVIGLVALLAAGRVAPQRPDLDRWLGDDEPALDSPRLAEAARAA